VEHRTGRAASPSSVTLTIHPAGDAEGVAAHDGGRRARRPPRARPAIERLDLLGARTLWTARPTSASAACRPSPRCRHVDRHRLWRRCRRRAQRGGSATFLDKEVVVARSDGPRASRARASRRDAGQKAGARRRTSSRISRRGRPRPVCRRSRGDGGPARKLPSSRFPSDVRMDSGWNCTPSTGQRR